jgi:hypothetical protein
VSGPPWPELVATGSYTPPPLIRWPIFAGLVAFAVYVAVAAALASAGHTANRNLWLLNHESTIRALNRDQTNLVADNPTRPGGNAKRWLSDLRTFHDDAVTAASLPNPGGKATVPWREMLGDYVNGSAEIVQAVESRNGDELAQASRDLDAGDQAAHQFNQAMGITAP